MNIVATLVSVAQTSVTVFDSAVTTSRKVVISNNSANPITISQVTAVANTGFIIPANSNITIDTTGLTASSGGREYVPTLKAISGTGTNAVGVAAYTE